MIEGFTTPNPLLPEYESEKQLRKRIFLGFATITFLLSLLFIFEGYDASLQFGRQVEFTHQHANAMHAVESMNDTLTEFQTSDNNDNRDRLKSYLDKHNTTLHLNSLYPSAIIVDFDGRQSISLSNMQSSQAQRVMEVINRKVPAPETVILEKGLLLEQFIENTKDFLVPLDGTEFSWMIHNYGSIGTITIIQELNTSDMATSTVLPRLLISSLVVLWIGFWASFGVATFVSKRISKSNNTLLYYANYDTLTNLPNHNYLITELDRLYKEKSSRSTEANASLIFLSVNNIHLFEHTYGNSVKENIFKAFSEQLGLCKSENVLIGRYDSNMLYILIFNHPIEYSQSLAMQITQQFHEPIIVGSVAFLPSLNLGITHLSIDVQSRDELISHGLHAVKFAEENRQQIKVYSNELSTLSDQKIRRSAELARALSNNEFILLYQPKIDLKTGDTVGVEALVRWDHPSDGRLAPAEFLDLIETSCISRHFTQYIITKALEQLQQWKSCGYDIPIAVNISPYDLLDDEIVSFLEKTVEAGVLTLNNLEVELTETATTINVHHTSRVFKQLKSLGVKRSIDDFGTGMSSFSYLKEIPFNTVKIDRTFIHDLITNPASQAIVETILHLAQKLGWTVVAEGIENIEVAEQLKKMGCNIAQGFYFAKPMAPDDVINTIINNNR